MIADPQNPFSIDSLCQLQKVSGQCHLPFKSERVCSSARRLPIPFPLVNYRTLDRNYTEAFPPLSILCSMLLHPFPSRKAKAEYSPKVELIWYNSRDDDWPNAFPCTPSAKSRDLLGHGGVPKCSFSLKG
jgi:hypothetical protein